MKIHLVSDIKLIYFMYTKNSSKKPTLIQTCHRHIENKKKQVNYELFSQLAPLTDERCSCNGMIKYVTNRKLKD